MDLGHWIFPNEFNPDDWFGFVYRIIEIDTGKEYIGKKQFHSYLKKPVVGKKNKKRIKKESNWKYYTGSCDALNHAISIKGKENYSFYIESLHKSKASLTYAEVYNQIVENVLREKLPDNQTPKFYNKHIGSIKFIPPDEHSDETKMKISRALSKKYENSPFWRNLLTEDEEKAHVLKYYAGENNYLYRLRTPEQRQEYIENCCAGENNPMFGVEPFSKNKTYDQIYGPEISGAMKANLRAKCPHVGTDNGMHGKKHSEDTKEKWRVSGNRSHPGEKNGMFGRPCYFKMSEKEITEWKENISKSGKGKPKPEGFGEKVSQSSKGHKKPTATCPYCNKTGSRSNMLRYHFEKCKFKPISVNHNN